MVGATTGATVKIIVISDISFAASLPLEISRTIARDSTTAEAPPKPWTKRAASITSMLCASAATVAASANRLMPT